MGWKRKILSWDRILDRGIEGCMSYENGHSFNFSNAKTACLYPNLVRELIVADSITSIPDYMFSDFKNLKLITISPAVREFGARCFANTGLTGIYLPFGGKYFGNFAFSDCKKLQGLLFPASTEKIGAGVIEGCESLVRLGVDSACKAYFSEGNCVLHDTEDGITLAAGCQTSVIPNTCEIIGNFSFARTNGLQVLRIPESVKQIGEFAFYNCQNLQVVNFGSGSHIIKPHAFIGCESLLSLVLGENCTAVGDYCFAECASLQNAYIPLSVKKIGKEIFSECERLETIYCETDHKPIGWSKFWADDCPAKVVWGANSPIQKLKKLTHPDQTEEKRTLTPKIKDLPF